MQVAISATSAQVVCARAALQYFPQVQVRTQQGYVGLSTAMVAVAGAESGWNPLSRGDYGLGHPTCNGDTSFGLWQIHLPTWYAVVQHLSGIPASNPCGQAAWLCDAQNNARMTAYILTYRNDPQGALQNWSTWNDGAYLQHLAVARAAVAEAQGSVAVASALVATNPSVPWPVWVALAGGGALVVLGVVVSSRRGA